MNIHQKLVLILTLVFSGSSNSAILTDNLGEPHYGGQGSQGIPPGWIANAFSTGTYCPNGCALGDITLKLATGFEGTFNGVVLQLFSDAGDVPGATAIGHAYVNPATATSTPYDNTFSPNPLDDGQPLLANNTTYWVKLDASAPNAANVDWSYMNVGAGKWAFGIGDNVESWSDTGPFMMKVEATPVSLAQTPIPGAAWLMGSALMGLLWRKKNASESDI